MEAKERPAFYALLTGGWRDYVTLLPLPYTAWHLSYVMLGAASAPTLQLDRLGWVTLAFFLAVGLAAHALDELNGRPLRTRIPTWALAGIAGASLLGALGVGIAAIVIISPWAAAFVAVGVFLVLAYNLEWLGGWFHTDLWFGLAWGAFPALTAYWASAERLDAQAGLVAGACCVLSLAQRVLSTQVRRLRRRAASVEGRMVMRDGSVQELDMPRMLATPEAALRLLSLAVPLLAMGWLLARV